VKKTLKSKIIQKQQSIGVDGEAMASSGVGSISSVALVNWQPQKVKRQQSTGGKKQQSILNEEAMERLHNAVGESKQR